MLISVIPAFNEQETIGAVVMQARQFGEVIVVNDGSRDRTAQIALEAGAEVLDLKKNSGYDAALGAGIRHAWALGPDYIMTLDGDGELDAADGARLAQACHASGLAWGNGIRPMRGRIGEKFVVTYSRYRYGIRDILCGLKVFRPTLLPAGVEHFAGQNVGMRLPVELVKSGFPPTQLNVSLSCRADIPRFGGGLSANLAIVRAMVI